MNKPKLVIPKTPKGKKRIQFYMDWWAEAWRERGGECKYEPFAKPRLFAVLGRIFNFRILPSFGNRLIVFGSHRIERMAWPWNMFYEIVPIMWDVWPTNRNYLVKFIKNNRVKTIFCTSS